MKKIIMEADLFIYSLFLTQNKEELIVEIEDATAVWYF